MWLVLFLSSEVCLASSSAHTSFFFLILILPIKNGQDRTGVWATLLLLGTDPMKAPVTP